MKVCFFKLLVLLVCVVSSNFAIAERDFQGELIDVADFEAITSAPMTKMVPWASSYHVCHATTVCPNGMPIFCQVYGAQAMGGFGSYANACRWFVIPGRAVRCQGYVQQMGPMGLFWTWVDYPVACF